VVWIAGTEAAHPARLIQAREMAKVLIFFIFYSFGPERRRVCLGPHYNSYSR
jgi:hypothetical protein